MLDVRRRDQELLVKELVSVPRILLTGVLSFLAFAISKIVFDPFVFNVCAATAIGLTHVLPSYRAAIRRRFHLKRFESLWQGCVDRLDLFYEVQKKMERERTNEWTEMPKTIKRVAQSLYLALRRADIIAHEVAQTEKGMYSQPPPWVAPSHDPEAKELYQIADKNIAEYRTQFGMVMAGVHRTEAQCAVFMTTVDTLRMKLIGYRLVGKAPELNKDQFLDAMTEAKLQLHAIDQALDELELGAFRAQIGAMPPPIPDEIDPLRQRDDV